MTVEFESSLEDFVDVHMHVQHHRGDVRRWKWSLAVGAVWGTLGSFWMLSTAIPDIDPLFPVLFSIAIAGGMYAFGNSLLRSRTRKHLEKSIDGDPILCIVGIHETGLFYKQLGTFVELEWRKVESLEETEERLFFELVGIGSLSVPKHAFDSEAECEQFIVLGANYINSVEELYP